MEMLVGKINDEVTVFELLETTPKEFIEQFKKSLENGDLKKLYELREFISVNSFSIFVEFGGEVSLYSRQKIATLEVRENA